ncbi:MAG: hypothetical protein JWP79_2750 [Polaromonas sp.]|nr:hypothetical protein [Polaromonas sp.]MDB5845440.1 hypothetical protein [Polaromonas sp.]
MADGFPQRAGDGADKFRPGKGAAQPDHERSLRICPGKISAHGVNLPFDGVARHSAFGPAFGNHRTDPHVLLAKQAGRASLSVALQTCAPGIKPVAVQGKVRRFGNDGSGQNGLELGPGLKPLHWRPASVQAQKQPDCPQKTRLDSQAFAAFGTSGRNDGAAATGFHACQETVGTGALDFGRLVCAFHDKSWWPYRACYWAVSGEASFGDSNDLG